MLKASVRLVDVSTKDGEVFKAVQIHGVPAKDEAVMKPLLKGVAFRDFGPAYNKKAGAEDTSLYFGEGLDKLVARTTEWTRLARLGKKILDSVASGKLEIPDELIPAELKPTPKVSKSEWAKMTKAQRDEYMAQHGLLAD